MTDLKLPEGQYVTLKDGVKYPKIGLGTWKSPTAGVTAEAVKAAIRAGYRMIDTANDYGNEAEIGKAIKELIDAGEITRGELFIQSKLWNSNHRADLAWIDLNKTLEDLQVDYIDCFLIHWPQACPAHPTGAKASFCRSGQGRGHYNDDQPEGGMWMFPVDDEGYYTSDKDSHYIEALHTMEDMKEQGKIRTIGVSNFNRMQLTECVNAAKKHPVTVVQNEIHPYFQQKDFVDFCQMHKIQVQAFSPLGSADRPAAFVKDSDPPAVFNNPVLKAIGDKYGKSVAQVVLRWHLTRNVSAVPKSITPSRIAENYKLFDFTLDEEDMKTLNGCNIGWRFLLWDETAMHPDYPFKDELPYNHEVPKAPMSTSVRN
eukprot:TRINITY_DN24662_c0_g1_i1.p1 TRINITY_DN24662_c0_g1~~TRINITY_DN24662_c0_g1_i1.p1  ORF type:complete len:371 (+),score=193.99 TRINITY_DN24662_c0_g1_i1:75-1187(+)